jgi:hypothetical protein
MFVDPGYAATPLSAIAAEARMALTARPVPTLAAGVFATITQPSNERC